MREGMMKLKNREIVLKYRNKDVNIIRNSSGIPEITSSSVEGIMYGLGRVHAHDRQLQSLITRILVTGRTAEILAAKDELVELDMYMRRLNFIPDESEERSLRPEVRERAQAYCDGFNDLLNENGTVWEFKLLGYRPEPWTVKDCLTLGRIIGFFGQTDSQNAAEKFIIQMIRNDVPEEMIKGLFPSISEEIDYDLIKKIRLEYPVLPDIIRWISLVMPGTGSNNWAVSGEKTASGNPFICNDPHLEVNRLPPVWYETVLKIPGNFFIGVTFPGLPAVPIGRSRFVSWSATFAFIDMMDYKIEHCRERSYRRGDRWVPFSRREEIIKKKKGQSVKVSFCENDNGVIEGEAVEEGNYLCMNWAAKKSAGADILNCALDMEKYRTVEDCIKAFRKVEAIAVNWVFADSNGNIGYQMSGRAFNRPDGVSGLIPTPAWDSAYEYRGFISNDMLPSCYNPQEGIIVSANNDLNHLGKSRPINLCMAPYRYDRIRELLLKGDRLGVEDMKKIQYDIYSHHAEKFMKILRPLIPGSRNGRILKEWDMKYSADSEGAVIFDSVYKSLIRIVFGDNCMGREAVNYLMEETIIFSEYSGNFDSILLSENSAWFKGIDRKNLYARAIEEGLDVKAERYGNRNRTVMKHLLFGGMLPRFFGFDYGPVEISGGKGTVCQGIVFRYAGRDSSLCPSYRMISDMGTDEVHTNLPGGPSDRRFSRWYRSEIKNWLEGTYKILKGG